MQVLMGSKPTRIWVGNSVAQRAIDPEKLPAGEVRLALDGAEMAHWVAALERLDLQNTQVLVYASTVHLGELELSATRDRELFWALAPADGGSARAWAVDQPPWMGPLLQERGRVRDRILNAVGRGPARALWGGQADALLEEAQSQTPVMSTAMAGRGERERKMPEHVPVELQDLVQAAGGELVWVLPYQRGASPCRVHPLVQELSEQPGVRVIDLSSSQLPRAWFGSEMHMLPNAQGAVTELLLLAVERAKDKELTQICGD
jgi:hypothetical protein